MTNLSRKKKEAFVSLQPLGGWSAYRAFNGLGHKRKCSQWGGVVFGFMLVLGFSSIGVAGNTKVEICHFPPENPANFHTITVSENAVDTHMTNHGDVVGACCSLDNICDDGNVCTANFCIDEACTSEPVDCNDSVACTVDSCDALEGCSNVPDDGLCSDGEICDPIAGCVPEVGCPCWSLEELASIDGVLRRADPYDNEGNHCSVTLSVASVVEFGEDFSTLKNNEQTRAWTFIGNSGPQCRYNDQVLVEGIAQPGGVYRDIVINDADYLICREQVIAACP